MKLHYHLGVRGLRTQELEDSTLVAVQGIGFRYLLVSYVCEELFMEFWCEYREPYSYFHYVSDFGSLSTESSNGYVVFKFGTTQLYDDPPRFISSSVAQDKSTTYTDADREVIDCTAIVYRMPEQSALVSPFRWGYHAHEVSMQRSLKLPTSTFIPGKSVGLPMNLNQSHRAGNLADHLVKDLEFGNESIADFLHISSSDAEMAKLLPKNM